MLHVSDLSVGYGRKAILSQLDFRIEAGSLTVILGRNGCGKSTLLRCLSGQKKPLQGTVSWNGAELFSLEPSRLAQTLALLPQGLPVPDLTVRELVACGRAPWGRGGEAQIAQAMVTADVAQFAGTPMEQLSGGERQRAWLAMTLAQDTPLLLLDEPTTYLDPAQQFRFMDTLQGLSRQGKTIVAVLHDLPLALRYASQVLLLDAGQCVYHGSAADAAEPVERVFGVERWWR